MDSVMVGSSAPRGRGWDRGQGAEGRVPEGRKTDSQGEGPW